MCHGGYDPKYMMRDIEDRMKGVAFIADKSETPLQVPEAGLMAWLRVVFRRKYRKDTAHG
jgi:hypothetical protein